MKTELERSKSSGMVSFGKRDVRPMLCQFCKRPYLLGYSLANSIDKEQKIWANCGCTIIELRAPKVDVSVT